jgi:hypothetical protein
MTRMKTPAFFDAVPPIVVFDPLAEALRAAEDGIVEYRYADAVKLAGHSCPTVACAWLMTRRALQALYPETLPRRGDVRVELRAASEEGVTGVIASIAGFVTGAANESGFKGLAGRFGRRDLLLFGVPLAGEIRFTRLDTGNSVSLSHDLRVVAQPPGLRERLREAFAQDASDHARKAFAAVWQDWVKTILIGHADDPRLIAAAV